MATREPYPTDTYRRGSAFSRGFLPLALITLGVVFLLGNLVPESGRGGLVLVGLGAAFTIGRLTTGRYGYAVPAGVLMAIGAYITLHDALSGTDVGSSGLFFVLLGLGFAAVYAIGMRPASIWPLFPATILIGLGLIVIGVASLGPLASFSWIATYWPITIVLPGLWLLFRESLPPAVRRPIATLGGLALLAYGILAAAASVAAGGTFARTGVLPEFAPSPFTDTVTLEAPISPGQTLVVSNSNGRTTIHGGNEAGVHVTATRHFNVGGHGPEVRLVPSGNGLSLDASTPHRFPFGEASWVEYSVDVPTAIAVRASTSGGQLEIDGVGGAVDAQSSSGSITLHDLSGDVRASSSSGGIHGDGLRHLHQAQTSSGSIWLSGVFKESARVSSSSGSVNLSLLPDSAIQLDVHTGSGSIQPHGGLQLRGGETRRDRLTGAVGEPVGGATLSIQTSSGSVIISQQAATAP